MEKMNILKMIKTKKAKMNISFEEIVEKWLEYKKIDIKKSSYSNYEYKISKYLMPYLKNKSITQIEKYCMKENSAKELGILLCLNTGMRIGEICALKWKDIDLDRRIIYVCSTMERIYDKNLKRTKIIIDTPKTKSSMREIPMSNKLYNVLKPLKKKCNNNQFFLTGDENKYIEPRSYQYIYKRALRKCKLKPHKFHCLRHSFASECIEVGMDIKALSEILGHSNVNITLNIYVHSSYKNKKKYLEKI